MYYVDDTQFDELLDAIEFCKSRPTTVLTDEKGTVLMAHVSVTFEDFRDIHLAKAVLEIQTH
jgi:hypothetical protein